MKVLVTGVAGFIGSHLAERLMKDRHEVIGMDCFTDYYARDIKESNIDWLKKQSNFTFYEKDILKVNLVQLLKDIDIVFHEAAQAGVRTSWGENFKIYTENNVLATQNLLEAAKKTKLEKFIYASSSSVYGDAETYPTNEAMKPAPVSPYGVTKLAGENLCRLYWKNYDVPIISLRYFTVYGPRQRPDMAFYKFIKALLNDLEIVVFGDGTQTRDFTYIDDVIDANILAMNSSVTGETVNIGGGSRITLSEVIKIIEKLLGKKAKIKYIEKQKGDVNHTAADITKAQNLLKYRPEFDLAAGLANEISWLKNILKK